MQFIQNNLQWVVAAAIVVIGLFGLGPGDLMRLPHAARLGDLQRLLR